MKEKMVISCFDKITSVATTHPAPAMDGYSVVGHSTPPLISNSIGYGAPSSPPMSPRPPLKSEYTVVHHFVEPPAKKPHKGRRVPICHDTAPKRLHCQNAKGCIKSRKSIRCIITRYVVPTGYPYGRRCQHLRCSET